MATALPTGQRGQVLAAGLALLALVVVWLGMVSPLLGWYGARSDTLEAMQARAAREAALIEALPALRQEAQNAARTPARAVLPATRTPSPAPPCRSRCRPWPRRPMRS